MSTGEPGTGTAGAIERAAAAYSALAELAETVEDEWQYIADLVEAYLPAIRALRLPGGAARADAETALDEACAEIAAITDPHRAIDWLSTFPHVAALAVGGDVDGAGGDTEGPATGSSQLDEPDEGNPFAALLRGRR